MWKDIPNWENLYEVNECGDVRNKVTNKIITPDHSNKAGYLRVTLYNKPRQERFLLHRLAATLFIPNPNNFPEVNHKNGNKHDCSVENLEWCNRTYNEHEKKKSSDLYKPFIIEFANGIIKQYDWKPEAAKDINVSKTLIQWWLHNKSKSYVNYGIKNIAYIKA